MSDAFTAFTDDPEFDAAPEAPSSEPALRGRLATAEDALKFMLGGNATVTFVSKKSGQRFTYRLKMVEDRSVAFVSLLTGSDNESDYSYLGRLAARVSGYIFWAGRKVPRAGDVSPHAPSSKAFAWAWKSISRGVIPEQLEIWHEGKCGRCGRKLTVPTSVAQGFGPECINHV